MIHDSLKTKAIRKRMDEVRCDLDEGVQDIVEGARDMGSWRYYLKTYPWISLGVAAAAVYLIVPRRFYQAQPSASARSEFAGQSRVIGVRNMPPQGGALLTFVGNLVMRSVLSYVGQQAGQLFAAQTPASRPNGVPRAQSQGAERVDGNRRPEM
jgi:hypothetical protein